MYGAIQLDATAASVPAIIGLKDGFEPSLRSSAGKADVHLFSLEDALSLASLDFRGQVVPEQWETEFRSNYGG